MFIAVKNHFLINKSRNTNFGYLIVVLYLLNVTNNKTITPKLNYYISLSNEFIFQLNIIVYFIHNFDFNSCVNICILNH